MRKWGRERERKRAQRERKGAARERGRGQRKMRERAMGSDTYIWDKSYSILAFVNLTVTKLYTVRLNPNYFCVRFVLLLYRNKAKTIIYS